MISEFKTIPKALYYVQTADGCTVLDPDGDTLAEITAPGGYFPGIGSADAATGTVTFSSPVKRVIGPFDLAPQQKLAILGVLGGNNTGLPTGYAQLAYIESTGTQYIDTGILPNGRYKVSVSVLSRVWDGYNNSNPVFFAFVNPKWYFYSMAWQGVYQTAGQRGYGSQRYSLAYPPMHELNVRYDIVCDKNKTIRNGVELGSIGGTFVEEDFEFSRITILLLNRTDVKTSPTSKVLYSFSVEDSGRYLANYIPVINSAGQVGMYDEASRSFKSNVGAGDFIAGIETQQQLVAMLRMLPDRTGQDVGTLQVRLAESLQTAENEARLDAMLAKNWEITQAV